MAGDPAEEPVGLGSLATAWPRCARARSPPSCGPCWRPRHGATPVARPGGTCSWACGCPGRPGWPGSARPPRGRRARPRCWWPASGSRPRGSSPVALQGPARSLLGAGALGATSLAELERRLPGHARWVLAAVEDPADLWLAEAGWWSRVERDGFELLGASGFGAAPVLGAVAVLAADAWRVGAPWSWPPAAAGPWRCSMPWRERLLPVRMQRVALVAPGTPCGRCWSASPTPARSSWTSGPRPRRRSPPPGGGTVRPAAALARGTRRGGAGAVAVPARPGGWERAGRWDLLAGEAELEERAPAPRSCAAGWRRSPAGPPRMPCPAWRPARRGRRRRRAAAAPARRRPADPAARCRPAPLADPAGLETYATVPYADVDPTVLAAVAYVVMFGMMFGDVGHGVLLLLAAALLRAGRPRRLARLPPRLAVRRRRRPGQHVLRAAVRRVLRADRVVPVLWLEPAGGAGPAAAGRGSGRCRAARRRLRPRDRQPLAGGRLAAGAVRLLRHRRAALFLGLGLAAGGWYARLGVADGRRRGVAAAVGLALAFVGFARRGRWGRRPAPPRPRSSCSTWWCGWAPTSCRSPGWPPSGSPTPPSARSSGTRTTGLWGGAAWRRARRRCWCSSSATRSRSRWRPWSPAVQALRLEYYELFSRCSRPGPAVPALAASRSRPRRGP